MKWTNERERERVYYFLQADMDTSLPRDFESERGDKLNREHTDLARSLRVPFVRTATTGSSRLHGSKGLEQMDLSDGPLQKYTLPAAQREASSACRRLAPSARAWQGGPSSEALLWLTT